MTDDTKIRMLLEEAEELDAEIFLIEETILLSPINEEEDRRLRSLLVDKRAQAANIRAYIYQLDLTFMEAAR